MTNDDKKRNAARRMRRLRAVVKRTAERLDEMLFSQYGMSRVKSMRDLQTGTYVLKENSCDVTVAYTLGDRLMMSGALRMAKPRKRVGIFSTWQLPVSTRRERELCGHGFGTNLWRWNSTRGGVEISFGDGGKRRGNDLLVALGFVWNNMRGVWFRGFREDGEWPTVETAATTAALTFGLRKAKDHIEKKEAYETHMK